MIQLCPILPARRDASFLCTWHMYIPTFSLAATRTKARFHDGDRKRESWSTWKQYANNMETKRYRISSDSSFAKRRAFAFGFK